MEAINDKKRKKRKTRRCLDELRKKTHEPNGVCKVNYNTDAKLHNNKANCLKNNYVTSNRLTLLNKAVRSETVTRCQVSELEGKNFEINSDRQTINSHTNILSENNNKAIALETQNQHNTEDEIEILSPNLNKDNKIETPKSIILFSPESEKEKAINTTLENPLETSPISSSPSIINTNIEAKLFADIMNGIETYLVQNFPQFVSNKYKEVTRANIAQIQAENKKIYASLSPDVLAFYKRPYIPIEQIEESGYRWHYCDGLLSPNDLTFHNSPYSTSSANVPILQNSTDGNEYSWSQYCCCETRGNPESSPMIRTSSSSMSFEIHSTSPVVSGIYETPEYRFYPHRLN